MNHDFISVVSVDQTKQEVVEWLQGGFGKQKCINITLICVKFVDNKLIMMAVEINDIAKMEIKNVATGEVSCIYNCFKLRLNY